MPSTSKVRKIDPTVDCVFKRLFGCREHMDIALSFLNDVLELTGERRLTNIAFLDPAVKKRHIRDKAPVVDVRVTDMSGNMYQIEMQNFIESCLLKRVFYGWSRINALQLEEGVYYDGLKDGVSIWILNQNIFPLSVTRAASMRFVLHCPEEKITIRKDSMVLLIQLLNFTENDKMSHKKAGWIRFLKEAAQIDPNNPPEWAAQGILKKAVKVLQNFANDKMAFIQYDNELRARRETEYKEKYHERTRLEAEALRKENASMRKDNALMCKQNAAALKREATALKRAKVASERVQQLEAELLKLRGLTDSGSP